MFRLDILDPETIDENESLTDGSMGLDSLDLIELAMSIEEAFGIAIHRGEERQRAFSCIASIADFIHVGPSGQLEGRDRFGPEMMPLTAQPFFA